MLLFMMLGLLASAGAQCSNTCGYSNDGDCDDGGPGSELSFGTDCADVRH